MLQVWFTVDPVTGVFDSSRPIEVDSSIAPTESPALPGNPVVPAGAVRMIGSDGSQDNVLWLNGHPVAYITQFVVPYVTGGWPPDPLFGQPGHTMQDWDGRS